MFTMKLFTRDLLLIMVLTSNVKISLTAKYHISENSNIGNVENDGTSEMKTFTISALQLGEQMEHGLKTVVKTMGSFDLLRIMEISMKSNLSEQCIRNFIKLRDGVRSTRTWAMNFVDSSAKTIDGVLSLTSSSFGSFDQCINTEAINDQSESNYGEVLFRGKYCALDVTPQPPEKKSLLHHTHVNSLEVKNLSTAETSFNEEAEEVHFSPLRLGICIPSGCTEEDLEETLQQVIKEMPIALEVRRCEIKEKNHYNILQIVIISIFSFVGLLVLCGTLTDHYICYKKQEFKNLPARILLCFSFTKNIKQLFKTNSSPSEITCLHSIRFLSAAWIILLHTYFVINSHLFREMLAVFDFAEDFAALAIANADLAVDTFFCIGGMLVSYNNVRKVKISNQPFSVPSTILRRIFRIHPPYLFAIALVFLVPLMGSGPIWHDTVDEYPHNCYRSWWKNVLFINNFLPSDMCLVPCWFIAADMQLYIITLFVLIPTFKWPKIGLTICFVLIFTTMIASSVVSYVKNLPPAFLFRPNDVHAVVGHLELLYFTPYAHAGPYFIGVIVGYFLATRPKVQIPKSVQIVGWLLAIICNVSVLYGIYEWSKGKEPNALESTLYGGFHRTAWSLGVAWIIFCCHTGHGGVVNLILSWKAWMPFGHLSYFAYLLHPIIMLIWLASSRQGLQMSHPSLVWIFFGNLVVTFGISVGAYLAIESPFMSLQRIVFGTGKRKETNAPGNNVHEANNRVQKQKNDEMITVLNVSMKSGIDGIENTGYVYKP